MVERVVGRLLWDRRLSSRSQRAWFVLLLLSPVALWTAMELQGRLLDRMPVSIGVDRAKALAAVHALAEARGIDTSGWFETVRSATTLEAYKYLVALGEPGRRLLTRWAPWSRVEARLVHPEGTASVTSYLSLRGEPMGYHVRVRESGELGEGIDDARALAIAKQRQVDWATRVSEAQFAAAPEEVGAGAGQMRVYRWRAAIAGAPELRGELTVRLRGAAVIEEAFRFVLSAAGKQAVEPPGREWHQVFYAGFLVLLGIGLVVRYVRRRLQKEASRQRMYLVALLTTANMIAVIWLTDQAAEGLESGAFGVVMGTLAAGLSVLGLVAGMVYAAAESDLREPYGDRLVSLDAALSGRLLSRNVGRSLVLGTVVLCWMLLGRNLLYLAVAGPHPGADILAGGFEYVFAREAWLVILLSSSAIAVFVVLTSVMGPLSLVTRRMRRWPRLERPGMLVFAWFTYSFLTGESLPWWGSLPIGLVQAGALLAAFYAVDVLAVLVVAAGQMFLVYFAGMAHFGPLWREEGEWALVIAAVTLAAAGWSVVRGRAVRPEEVRPDYAREIQERVALQSEVMAAREAQLRLLPASPPAVTGIRLAASVRAAEQVSGDFYDFYPTGPSQVGILLSDGGANGLATALLIALSKGYLMQRARAGADPRETLEGLLRLLGAELHGIRAEGLCYMVADGETGVVRWARYGTTPALLVAGDGAASQGWQELVLRTDSGFPLFEGQARLAPQSRLIFYTNGLAKLIGEPDTASSNRWLERQGAGIWWQSAAELHDSILTAVWSKAGRKAKRLEDDVTVLVLSGEAAQPMEQVA